MNGQAIIEQLETRRKELGMTDEAFARLLGISRPLWSQLRSGRRRLTLAVLRGILRAFPDWEEAVLALLREEA